MDNFPPGVAGSESQRGSQEAESVFYSKPLGGQHVGLLELGTTKHARVKFM